MLSQQRKNFYDMSRVSREQNNSREGPTTLKCPCELVCGAAMAPLSFATGKSKPTFPQTTVHNTFAELFPFEMWIFCLKNMHLTSNQYVIQTATALPCHVALKGEQKREQGWKDGGKILLKMSLFCIQDVHLFWRDCDLLASSGPLYR